MSNQTRSRLSIDITAEERSMLKMWAAYQNKSISEVVRDWIKFFVTEQNKPTTKTKSATPKKSDSHDVEKFKEIVAKNLKKYAPALKKLSKN